MKKNLVLLLALIIVFSAANAFGAKKTQDSASALEFELETIYGDVSAAEGLTIRNYGSYLDDVEDETYLQWQTDLFIRNGAAEHITKLITNNRFALTGNFDYMTRDPGNHGYGIRARFDLENTGLTRNNHEISSFFSSFSKRGDAKNYREQETSGPYTYFNYRINLSEFYKYYPYLLEIDLPSDFNVSEEAFREFFRIPVLESENYKLNTVSSWNITKSEMYEDTACIDTFGGLTEDAYYFTFCNRTRNNNILDTSQISVGYGIYRIAKDGTFSLFKALPEDSEVRNLGVDKDGKTMYLHCVENNSWVVHVINIADGTEISRIPVKEYWFGDSTPKVFHGNGGEVIAFLEQKQNNEWWNFWYASEVYLVNRESARMYVDSKYAIDMEHLPYKYYVLRNIGVFSATVLGDKLAIVKRDEDELVYNTNGSSEAKDQLEPVGVDAKSNAFLIFIFGPDGMEYCGRCRCSLDEANIIADFGETAKYSNGATDRGMRFIWRTEQYYMEDFYLTWQN